MLVSARLGRALLRVTLALCATSLALRAQLPAPPASTEAALHEMFDQASIIFTGKVTAIRHIGSANGSTGTIEVDFAVDDAILAVAPGATYTLREWAGLAPGGESTLIIGRRYLVFLHAPGPSGLSSPVGGPDGAIPILPANDAASPTAPDAAGLALQTALAQIARSPAHTSFRIASDVGCPTSRRDVGCSAASSPLASAMIDLRWIATRVLTPISYAPDGPAAAHPILAQARLAGSSAPETGQPTPQRSPPTQSANYPDILALLRSWQAQSNAAR